MESQATEINVADSLEHENAMTKESRKIRENFQIFGLSTLLYACVYTLCMYKK